MVILDFTGWKLKNGDTKLDKRLAPVMQTYFPERLGKAYLVNTPTIFSSAWGVFKTFLDKRVISKVTFLSLKDAARTLPKLMSSRCLPPALGGSNTRDLDEAWRDYVAEGYLPYVVTDPHIGARPLSQLVTARNTFTAELCQDLTEKGLTPSEFLSPLPVPEEAENSGAERDGPVGAAALAPVLAGLADVVRRSDQHHTGVMDALEDAESYSQYALYGMIVLLVVTVALFGVGLLVVTRGQVRYRNELEQRLGYLTEVTLLLAELSTQQVEAQDYGGTSPSLPGRGGRKGSDTLHNMTLSPSKPLPSLDTEFQDLYGDGFSEGGSGHGGDKTEQYWVDGGVPDAAPSSAHQCG